MAKIISILSFPAVLAVVLPLALLVAFHQGTSHKLRLAVVAENSRATLLADERHRGDPSGFEVRGWRTPAPAAAGVRAGEIAAATGGRAPRVVDLASQASGYGGIGIFFLVFPLMVAGAITTILLRRLPTWGIGRRIVLVGACGLRPWGLSHRRRPPALAWQAGAACVRVSADPARQRPEHR